MEGIVAAISKILPIVGHLTIFAAKNKYKNE